MSTRLEGLVHDVQELLRCNPALGRETCVWEVIGRDPGSRTLSDAVHTVSEAMFHGVGAASNENCAAVFARALVLGASVHGEAWFYRHVSDLVAWIVHETHVFLPRHLATLGTAKYPPPPEPKPVSRAIERASAPGRTGGAMLEVTAFPRTATAHDHHPIGVGDTVAGAAS